jgi:hypothetical protein
VSFFERLKRALGLSAEEDPLKREIEEMRRLASSAVREARIEKRKPKKEKAFEEALPEGIFPEELVGERE